MHLCWNPHCNIIDVSRPQGLRVADELHDVADFDEIAGMVVYEPPSQWEGASA